MAIVIDENYKTLKSGVRLKRIYSNAYLKIVDDVSGEVYDEVILPLDISKAYHESNKPIENGDDFTGNIKTLFGQGIIEMPEQEQPDYLHEHEPEPEYFI